MLLEHTSIPPRPHPQDRLLVDQSPEKHRSVLYDLNRVKFRQTLSAPKRFQGETGLPGCEPGRRSAEKRTDAGFVNSLVSPP